MLGARCPTRKTPRWMAMSEPRLTRRLISVDVTPASKSSDRVITPWFLDAIRATRRSTVLPFGPIRPIRQQGPAIRPGQPPFIAGFWSRRPPSSPGSAAPSSARRAASRSAAARGVAEAALLVAPGEVQELVERARIPVDVRCRVALLPEPFWHGVEAKVRWARRPGPHSTRPGSTPARPARADRIARRDRPVARVLVVVDEDAVPLLLPPLAGGAFRGTPPLDLAGQRQGGATDLDVVPARLDPHVHVDAPRAGGLRIADAVRAPRGPP